MATTAITSADFEKTITDNEIVFVDFWATWCGPCRAFGPIFEAASNEPENANIAFVKVDSTPTRIWPRPPASRRCPR